MDSKALVQTLREARVRTLGLVADLSDEQMIVPKLEIVNPLLWEIGHVAWFQELWALRHLRGHKPILEAGDAFYDSANVAHDIRWDLWLPSREKTLEYMQLVLVRVTDQMSGRESPEQEIYFNLLATFHEYMHAEAIAYTRQTLGYPAPKFDGAGKGKASRREGGELAGDVEVPGGTFLFGATPDLPFVFDNEKWAHPVTLKPFRIARAAVTNEDFLAFVEDRGYVRPQWWSEAGWKWREETGALHPIYWQREANARWRQREFDRFVPLREHLPVVHVNWFEAEAHCNWAGRRLPSEAEWEMAASAEPISGKEISERKRNFPWGAEPPTPERANLDWINGGCIAVGALPEGESAFGCRQMIGNVWEWTADVFLPFPGFVIDPYKEYSQPWFGSHKILRGGCWTTRSRLIRNTWRNFYTPDRRDVWAGFRTCAK
ncbi:MAG: selenoneine synthase SenA [Candidatus Binatia bacterium]